MEILTVKEAVARVHSGQKLEGVILEENSMKQVNVRDAMVLSEGGIVVPEQNIYYNDEDIEYDEEIDELVITGEITGLSWEEKAKRAQAYQQPSSQGEKVVVDLSTQQPEVDDWIRKNKQRIASLLKPIIVSLFQAEKMIRKGQK